MKRLALILTVVVAGVGLALGQSGAGAVTSTAKAVPASYLIGPNDVLAMTVFGAPELTDPTMRVDKDGTIHTPYGTTPVHVAGLTMAGAAQAVAAELVKDQLAVSPKVNVQVVDPQSHPVVIAGLGVRQPGTIQAIQPIRLLDALTKVGGLTNNNGAEITVVRPGKNGTAETLQISAVQLLSSANPAFNPLLYGGEQVRVMPGGNAYVGGAVKMPGAYPLSDTDPLTVRKLMARAHGLASAAKADQTQLIHNLGLKDQTTTRIDLPAILNGSAPDIKLAANDMVYVPTSGAKKAGIEALSRTLTILSVAAGQLLVR